MARQKHETVKLTLYNAGLQFGVPRNTIRAKLARSGVEHSPRKEYSIQEIYRALIQGGTLEEERIREIRAKADLLERQIAAHDRDHLAKTEMEKVIVPCLRSIGDTINRSRLAESDKAELIDHIQETTLKLAE
jgi:hypothetical protein